MKYYTVEKLNKVSRYSGIPLPQIQDVIQALNEFERRELEELKDYFIKLPLDHDVKTFVDIMEAESLKKLLKFAKKKLKNK
jgi:hypothetical protein